MIAGIVIVGVLLMALFVAVAVIGNRAQTRMNERERERLDARDRDGPGPS